MRLKKRLLSVALAAAMLFSLSTTAWAENGTTDGTAVQNVEGTVSTWESAEDDAANGQDAPAGDQQTGTETETVTGQEKFETQTIDPAQVPAPMSVVEEQDTEGAATDAVTTFEALQAAVEAAPTDGTETVIRLGADITAKSSLTVQQGQNVVLDFQGYKVPFAENFPAGRLFTNNGTLTLQGNGTVDARPAGGNGYGAVNNFGTLTVVDGTYYNTVASNASVIYNRSGGTLTLENPHIESGVGAIATEANTTTTIHGGYYFSQGYPTIENRGEMLITAGEFVNTSCSSCTSNWGYTVRSGVTGGENAHLTIQGAAEDSVKVTGVQGGLAVVGGTADIYNGVYKTVACQVHGDATAFYAGYFTGESYKTATNIYGGTFESASKTAILIGNSNPAPDSGKGEESTVMIYGGSFTGGDAAKTAITVDNTENAIGAATIYGGTFSSDPTPYLDEDFKMVQKPDGTYGVEELPAVAQIGTETYTSLEKAFAAAESGEMVTLLTNVDVPETILLDDGRTVTVDLNGNNIAFASKKHFEVHHGTLNLQGTGVAYEKEPYYGPVMMYGTNEQQENYSVVNIGENVTLRGWSGVFVDYLDAYSDYANGVVINVEGTLQSVQDNTGAYGHAIYVQGMIKQTNDTYAPHIHLLPTARVTATEEGNGMYLAGYAVTTIEEGATVTGGAVGIEIRAGKLTMTGGTVEATCTPTQIDPNGNGSTTSGAALAVSQHTTALPLEVTISGGTIRGYTGLYENCVESSNKPELVKVKIQGGNFAATNGGVNAVYADEVQTIEISGGYFTSEVPQDYLAEGKACNLLDSLYEGVYAYQVGEKNEDVADVQLEVVKPDSVAEEIDASEIPEVGSIDKSELASNLNTAAKNTQITDGTAQVVSNAVLVEAKVDGYKVNSTEVKEMALEALKEKADDSGATLPADPDVTITVKPILKVEPQAPVVENGNYKSVPFDIELLYQVTASATASNGQNVETNLLDESSLPAVTNPPVMDIEIKDVPVAALRYKDDVNANEVAKTLFVRHDHEGSVYYYRPIVNVSNAKISVTFTNEHGFSVFALTNDPRTVEVKYPTNIVTYTPTDIGASLMGVSQANFEGWTFAGVAGGPYKVMAEDLLTALANVYKGTPIAATAVFTENQAGGNSTTTTENTSSSSSSSTTTTTQSGSNITYYTCPACGYHNWTAGTDGYKCDHCGYVESVKQLSGYGNVKGVYEPKTSAAAAAASGNAAATSAIPQTSDELPLVCLVVVAIAALLGLGVTVVMKKRSNR